MEQRQVATARGRRIGLAATVVALVLGLALPVLAGGDRDDDHHEKQYGCVEAHGKGKKHCTTTTTTSTTTTTTTLPETTTTTAPETTTTTVAGPTLIGWSYGSSPDTEICDQDGEVTAAGNGVIYLNPTEHMSWNAPAVQSGLSAGVYGPFTATADEGYTFGDGPVGKISGDGQSFSLMIEVPLRSYAGDCEAGGTTTTPTVLTELPFTGPSESLRVVAAAALLLGVVLVSASRMRDEDEVG